MASSSSTAASFVTLLSNLTDRKLASVRRPSWPARIRCGADRISLWPEPSGGGLHRAVKIALSDFASRRDALLMPLLFHFLGDSSASVLIPKATGFALRTDEKDFSPSCHKVNFGIEVQKRNDIFYITSLLDPQVLPAHTCSGDTPHCVSPSLPTFTRQRWHQQVLIGRQQN